MDHEINHSQSERFKEMARMMECDEDKKRWKERLRKVMKQKVDKPAESLRRQS